jgi:hypothetical protein
MKANEFKEILESMEVGLFDKWMERANFGPYGIWHNVREYLAVGDVRSHFTGIGSLYDDNDSLENKQYWWDLMDKYNETIIWMGYNSKE